MASSSSPNINGGAKSSRFSTLKVFKLHKKEKEPSLLPPPPPPPPKDPYYLNNRSLASLSPDSLSLPSSPLSPPFHYPFAPRKQSTFPHPNSSTMSLVSSSASAMSYTPERGQHLGSKKSGFFRFTKRSPKSPSVKSSVRDETSTLQSFDSNDESISLPWNFQHNTHVDESYAGLPPSWAAKLQGAGYSEEEMAQIQARRTAGTRSPASQYLFSDRPRSPANDTSSSSNTSVVARPTPRTTSLPRQYSDASLSKKNHQKASPSNGSTSSNHTTPSKSPPVPINICAKKPAPGSSRTRNNSAASSTSLSISISSEPHHPDVHESSPPVVASPAGADSGTPSAPPRRVLHITNGSPSMQSPPPSYSKSLLTDSGYPIDKKDRTLFESPSHSTPPSSFPVPPLGTESPRHRSQRSIESVASRDASVSSHVRSSSSQSSAKEKRRSKRFTTLPPRLSLHAHEISDLSSWSEALISAIPSDLSSSDSGLASGSSAFATAGTEHSAAGSSWSGSSPWCSSPSSERSMGARSDVGPSASSQPSAARPNPPKRTPPSAPSSNRPSPPSRAIPPVVINGGLDEDEPSPSLPPQTAITSSLSPLYDVEPLSPASVQSWGELSGLISRNGKLSPDPKFSAPALSESHSPTLLLTPVTTITKKVEEKVRSGWLDDDEDRRSFLSAEDGDRERDSNRYSSQSSASTMSTATVTAATVRGVPVVERALVEKNKPAPLPNIGIREKREDNKGLLPSPTAADFMGARSRSPVGRHPGSPLSSHFGSEEGSGSGSSSSQSQENQTPTTDADPTLYWDEPSPDPSKTSFSPGPRVVLTRSDTFGGVHKEQELAAEEDDEDDDSNELDDSDEEEAEVEHVNLTAPRPTIVISSARASLAPVSLLASSGILPISPAQRYPGWLSEVVRPLEEFIDEPVDPREVYLDLQEIAEGESGSVYAATLADDKSPRLKLPPLIKAQDNDNAQNGIKTLVAIKSVAILPSGSEKLADLERELKLLKGLMHPNILGLDALYVDLQEDSLWIRMELMERSVADVIGLVTEGLMLQERMMARFASDVLEALLYLQSHGIAHRDVRSDNLLLNSHGILKLTDFSNATQTTSESSTCSDPVGVLYWQAPEVRCGPYDLLKVDVWSLGATVWEMAEAEPPFFQTSEAEDRWPPLTHPEVYSPAFREFLRACSDPPAMRPSPADLAKNPFINNSCGRPVIIQTLSQCMAIEKVIQERELSPQS
ncbi:STE/STE20/PAKA protein kinase [Armillaria mellea]|nr:STE/STE20/PAKA protein kinase [Armillaria mellea]